MTYNVAEPTDRDRVRGRIGDTDTADPILDDTTIDAILALKGGVLAAAIECCVRIMARFARTIDRSAAGMSASPSVIIEHYETLIGQLRREMSLEVQPAWGGTTRSQKDTLEADPDFVPASIQVRADDKPGVNQSLGTGSLRSES